MNFCLMMNRTSIKIAQKTHTMAGNCHCTCNYFSNTCTHTIQSYIHDSSSFNHSNTAQALELWVLMHGSLTLQSLCCYFDCLLTLMLGIWFWFDFWLPTLLAKWLWFLIWLPTLLGIWLIFDLFISNLAGWLIIVRVTIIDFVKPTFHKFNTLVITSDYDS